MLYLALIALLSLGVGTLVRDSAVSIGTVLALLYLSQIILPFIGNAIWQHRLKRWMPANAGLAIQATTGLNHLPIRPREGLGVLAIWAGAALLAGGLAPRRHDAKVRAWPAGAWIWQCSPSRACQAEVPPSRLTRAAALH